jgi:DNA-3-methyladenine glycosylase
MPRATRTFFATDPETLARRLLGCTLVRTLPDGTRLAGTIVETEAYLGVVDTCSHTFGGRRTARVASMWARPGTAYVYFTYGMHFCCNISAGREGDPVAVLLRALAPTEGLDRMREHRAGARRTPLAETDLCSGPARLCQALAIDRALDGHDLAGPPAPGVGGVGGVGGLHVERPGGARKFAPSADTEVRTGPRVGLGRDDDWARAPLRFALADSPHVSRPRL